MRGHTEKPTFRALVDDIRPGAVYEHRFHPRRKSRSQMQWLEKRTFSLAATLRPLRKSSLQPQPTFTAPGCRAKIHVANATHGFTAVGPDAALWLMK